MPQKSRNTRSALVLLTAGMIFATIALSIATWWRLHHSILNRSHTRSELREWDEIFSAVQDAETSQRGYLLTGDETYLAPFNKASEDLPVLLSELVRPDPEGVDFELRISRPEAEKLNRLMDQKMAELRETITVRRREGSEAAGEMVRLGVGKRLMDELRALFSERRGKLEAEIDRMTIVMNRDLTWGQYSIFVTSIVSLVTGALSWFLLMEGEVRARREERLAAEKRRAEQADREKSTFLATMSHEIRTPMNAILGFGELLLDEVRTEKEKRYAQSIVKSGNSLLQIINDILDLSKIEAGMMDIHLESTNVRDIADFVQQLFANQSSKKDVEIITEIQEDVPTSLMLDGARLRQILINLTGNALKFTDKGRVTLRFSGQRRDSTRSQYRLIIEVEDTGVGIPENRLKEIFKPFVQAQSNRAAEMKGTGLGLAIVKRLTELMDGTIQVESKVGKGSCFRVEFLGVEISARLPRSEVIREPVVDFNVLRPAHILVVDDNPTNRELVRGMFEKTHHQLSEAADGREALQAIARDRPDLVLMDIRMPVMDGRTSLKELRSKQGFDLLPVIAVTASSMAAEEESLRASFNGYVRKPYTRGQLYEEMSHFIPRTIIAPAEEDTNLSQSDVPVLDEWKNLIQSLRDLEVGRWPQVRDGMLFSEIQSFAQELTSLADSHQCAPLKEYATRLASGASQFALGELEKGLGEFPALIETLSSRVQPLNL